MKIKTVHLVGAIEFLENPDSGWRYELSKELESQFAIVSINPVTVSFLVGKDIVENMKYAEKLKREWRLVELNNFINDKIWPINAKSVDDADVIITVARTADELKHLSNSGGTIRELSRAVDQQTKPAFLVCECNDLTAANTHFLGLFLKRGSIFRSNDELFKFLALNKKLPEKINF